METCRSSKTHGWVEAGSRANHRMPSPMIAGPKDMKMRGPYRAASLPNRVENRTSRRVPGMPTRPAAAGL